MRLLGMFFTVCCLYFMGCLQTARPLFHENDLVFDERLVGVWQQGDETWTFERVDSETRAEGSGNGYLLTVSEKDSVVARCGAHLGYIDDYAFLDVFDGAPGDLNLPLHLIYRIHIAEKTLVLKFVDGKWFEALSQKEKAVLRIEKFDQGDIALASTDVLQRFLKDHYRDDVSGDANVLTRKE